MAESIHQFPVLADIKNRLMFMLSVNVNQSLAQFGDHGGGGHFAIHQTFGFARSPG